MVRDDNEAVGLVEETATKNAQEVHDADSTEEEPEVVQVACTRHIGPVRVYADLLAWRTQGPSLRQAGHCGREGSDLPDLVREKRGPRK